jgi:hypothetical protein
LKIGGHEHELLQSHAGYAPIFKWGADARVLGRVDLNIYAATGRLESIDWAGIPVTDATPDDPQAAAVIGENPHAPRIAQTCSNPDQSLKFVRLPTEIQTLNDHSFDNFCGLRLHPKPHFEKRSDHQAGDTNDQDRSAFITRPVRFVPVRLDFHLKPLGYGEGFAK